MLDMEIDEIVSIEEIDNDSLRYDITVAGTHNFFADGILVHNCQNLSGILVPEARGYLGDKEFYATLKMDGTSCTFYFANSTSRVEEGMNDVGVCSRNLDLRETEGNTYWNMFRKLFDQHAIDVLSRRGIALQGEICGPAIQGNPENFNEPKFFLFNVWDIKKGSYLPWDEAENLANSLGLECVPTLEKFVLGQKFSTVDEIVDYADGPSYNPKTKREGVVFKSVDGTASFKSISREYLLKHD